MKPRNRLLHEELMHCKPGRMKDRREKRLKDKQRRERIDELRDSDSRLVRDSS